MLPGWASSVDASSAFRDGEGVEHVTEVTAESLYETGALAIEAFRDSDEKRMLNDCTLKI